MERSFSEYNSVLSSYTKGRGPWELLYHEAFSTRGEAMKQEKFFKSGKQENF